MLQDQDLISIQEVRAKVEAAYQAWLKYRTYSQEQVDAIVERMAAAGRANAERLAAIAVEETGYGNVKDKVSKNLLCADLLPRTMRGMKTIGVLREIPEKNLVEIGVPMGVVAAVLPTTNPTSTAIYKSLISLKAGNAIVLSPHPRAKRCTCETAAVLYQAAIEAGAPEGVMQCIDHSSMEATNELMRHKRTGVILATGGSGMVRAAYSSGKPAFGVGPGNVPVLVDTSADISDAVAKVVEGKSFDYGTVCSSEQAIVAEESLRERILSELKARKAYICTPEQGAALAKILVGPNFSINPSCVGQAPAKIARMAGFEVPADTSIIAVEMKGVGKEHPLSAEKLSPVLSLLFVRGFAAAVDACAAILQFGGLGHTSVIHAKDDARIREYGLRMPSFRVLVNTPAPQGSTGITTDIFPSMTLGCGAVANNITSDNVGPQHLFNTKRIARVVRTVEQAFPDAGKNSGYPAPGGSAIKLDRQQIVSAVERYLAQRGVTTSPGPAAPASNAAGSVASIVDRFIAKKSSSAAGTQAAPGGPSCGCSTGEKGAASTESQAAAAPPPPKVTIVDFVCEEDVRKAMRERKKIFIGARTIVTPSARDLAGQNDILVMAG
jgi:acyl-CoA reductase-like NAD-dependent aldehyde dehydrogenase